MFFSRDVLTHYEAAFGRLHRDLGFLGVNEEVDDLYLLFHEKQRKHDTDIDNGQLIVQLRRLVSVRSALPGTNALQTNDLVSHLFIFVKQPTVFKKKVYKSTGGNTSRGPGRSVTRGIRDARLSRPRQIPALLR